MRASAELLSSRHSPAQGHLRVVLTERDTHSRSQTLRVSAVVPAMNEAENLPYVLPVLANLVDEVVLVDGHSTDDTIAVARMLVPEIVVVRQDGSGKGDALRVGFAAATGDIIVMLDADGSTNPNEIPAFVGTLLAGADVAKGTRFIQGAGSADITRMRKIGNRIFVSLTRLLYGGSYSDLCYGYNAFWRSVLTDLELTVDGFEIETVVNIRALRIGLDVREVPSFEHSRRYGVSNLRAVGDGWRILKAIFAEMRFEPNRSRRLEGGAVPEPFSLAQPRNGAARKPRFVSNKAT